MWEVVIPLPNVELYHQMIIQGGTGGVKKNQQLPLHSHRLVNHTSGTNSGMRLQSLMIICMKRGMSLLVEPVRVLVEEIIPVLQRKAEEWQEGNIPKLQIGRQNLHNEVVETSTRTRVGVVYPHIAGSISITVLPLTVKVRWIADGRTRAKVTPHPRFGILRERSLLLVVVHPNSVNSGTIQTPLAALNISSSNNNNNNGIIPAPLTVDSINNNNHVKRSRGPRQFSIKNQKGKCFSRHHISGVSVCVLCNDYHAK